MTHGCGQDCERYEASVIVVVLFMNIGTISKKSQGILLSGGMRCYTVTVVLYCSFMHPPPPTSYSCS